MTTRTTENTEISKNNSTSAPWWLVLLQGILSILIGVFALTFPGATLMMLARLLGWYWLFKGIFSLTAIFNPEVKRHRGWLLFNGVVGILAGITLLDHPFVSALFVPAMLITIIGIAGVLIGINDLLASFRGAGWGMALMGILSILLGGVLLFNTMIGVALMPYFIGGIELIGGLLAIIVTIKLIANRPR